MGFQQGARTALTLGATAAAVGAATLAWAAVEAHWYVLREVEVPVLPAGSRPVSVLHLSDLHLVPTQSDKIAWVRDLASVRPDLVVDTGDNFGHRDALWPLLHALEPLLDLPGAFVLGSNDYYSPVPKNPLRYLLRDSRQRSQLARPVDLPHDVFGAALRDAGWADLTNRRDHVTVGGSELELVGMDDPHLDRDRMPAAAGAPVRGGAGYVEAAGVAAAVGVGEAAGNASSVPRAASAAMRIGVVHAPYRRALDALVDDGCDLVLAGHTHGGQLCVPGYGALTTNCDLDRGRVRGLSGWPGARPDQPGGSGSAWLHVSEGVGTSPQVRLRLACRPAATLLTLVARALA